MSVWLTVAVIGLMFVQIGVAIIPLFKPPASDGRGGRVDFEGPTYVGQVKHVRRLSLAALEALAVEIATIGAAQGKAGVVVVKRRAGSGCSTTRLVVMTAATFQRLVDRSKA